MLVNSMYVGYMHLVCMYLPRINLCHEYLTLPGSQSGKEIDTRTVDTPCSLPFLSPPPLSKIPKMSKFALRGFILS